MLFHTTVNYIGGLQTPRLEVITTEVLTFSEESWVGNIPTLSEKHSQDEVATI